MRLPDEFDMNEIVTGVRWWHSAWRSFWVFGPPFSLVSSQGKETQVNALRGILTICTVLMSFVVVLFVVVFADEFDMSEAGGEPRKCYAHRVGSVQLALDVCRSVFFVWPWGLTRTMTSNLPVQLGSCVLSVLRGKGPHAALVTPSWECRFHPYLPS